MVDSLVRTDDGGSVWADEGTRAHTLSFLKASLAFGQMTDLDYQTAHALWLEEALRHDDDAEEMERHSDEYVALIQDIAAGVPHAHVHFEKRVQTGVPGSWGTADAIVVGVDVVVVVDYKYGQGVRVEVAGNHQLMLYGLGALDGYGDVLGTTRTVVMWIHQPRNGGASSTAMSAEDLRRWREDVALPAARETQHPDARFGPSDRACRWCPAAGACRPRLAHVTQRDFGNPDVLSAEELADAVRLIGTLRDWCKAVEAEALHQAYSEGKRLPGLKVVMSGGRRRITDEEAAVERLVAEGYDRDLVSRPKAQTLGVLEKVVGKKELPEVLGDLLVKGEGSPSLVEETDSREEISPGSVARTDFRAE